MSATPTPTTPPTTPPPAPPQDEDPPVPSHPRVIEQPGDARATITILAPRNPFLISYLPALIFGPSLTALAATFALVVLGVRRAGLFVLALVACGVAWLAAELPGLLRGLHTRVDIAIDPDEFRAVVRHLWRTRTHVYRRRHVIGVREISTGPTTRGLQVRFAEAEPLDLMAGYPDEQIAAAAAALRRALSCVAPAEPLLRADDPATLPYAGVGRSHEVEIRRLADGAVSVTVPPVHVASHSVGGVLFTLMWVVMFALLMRATGCWLVGLFIVGGSWGLAVAVREYVRRDRPLVLVATPTELVVENGPWFRSSRRFPRGAIRSIQCDASGAARRFVLRITARRDVELMADREIDEIRRVADALNEAIG